MASFAGRISFSAGHTDLFSTLSLPTGGRYEIRVDNNTRFTTSTGDTTGFNVPAGMIGQSFIWDSSQTLYVYNSSSNSVGLLVNPVTTAEIAVSC